MKTGHDNPQHMSDEHKVMELNRTEISHGFSNEKRPHNNSQDMN